MSAIFSAEKQLDNATNDSKVANVQQARRGVLPSPPLLFIEPCA